MCLFGMIQSLLMLQRIYLLILMGLVFAIWVSYYCKAEIFWILNDMLLLQCIKNIP